MKIYVGILAEYDDETVALLGKDYRVQIYEEELAFCLECDKIGLESQYSLFLLDATQTLFYISLKGKESMLDLDLQFADVLNGCKVNKILFYNKFDKFLSLIEELVNDLYEYNVENYEECQDTYYDFLKLVAEFKD